MEAYRDQYASLFRGGRDVVLLAVSKDSAETLRDWARDADFPFLFGSDAASAAYGTYGVDNRALFVIDPQGRIAYTAIPFREVDPTAYEDLDRAIEQLVPRDAGGNGESDAGG